VPAKDEASAIKKAGEVYLRTGNNERKVTGSYYTPDYIVRFIVEKTLAPVLEAIAERHATRDDDGQWHVRDSDALVRDVLALNVLDPATGSGHFVVDATSYIAEWLADLAIRPDDLGDEDELTYWKRQVASALHLCRRHQPLGGGIGEVEYVVDDLGTGQPLSSSTITFAWAIVWSAQASSTSATTSTTKSAVRSANANKPKPKLLGR
jgi:hypothetical protein